MADDTFVVRGPVYMSDAPLPASNPDAVSPPHPFKPISPPPAGQIGDVTTARAIETAERLIANGADRERIVAALVADGVDPALLDDRSPAQRAHDKAHGVPHYVDPSSYSFAIGNPPGIENVAQFSSDIRELASNLALPGDRGNAFCQLLAGAITSATQHGTDIAAVEAQTARNTQVIKNVFGDRYEAAAALINELLNTAAKNHPNQKLIEHLRPGGHACTPNMFGRLHSHALAMKQWAATAPKK